jgi:hypothetical protein
MGVILTVVRMTCVPRAVQGVAHFATGMAAGAAVCDPARYREAGAVHSLPPNGEDRRADSNVSRRVVLAHVLSPGWGTGKRTECAWLQLK